MKQNLADMYHVSFDLPKDEWLRIMATVRKTWPDEKLSDAELLRPMCDFRCSHFAISFALVGPSVCGYLSQLSATLRRRSPFDYPR